MDIKVTDVDLEIPALIHYADPTPARLYLPTDRLVMQGAFAYSGGWHPFVEALKHGSDALVEFYDRFRPTNLNEMYFLDMPDELGADLPPWELPWLFRMDRAPPPGEAGLSSDHGISFLGPATGRKIAMELQRLHRVSDSIRTRGYAPNEHGDIEGHFICVDGTYRFFVRGGKHRAAALAYLGWETIPVRMRSWWPRLIDSRMASDWPLVRDSRISPKFARGVLARYVQFDGTQQRTRWQNS